MIRFLSGVASAFSFAVVGCFALLGCGGAVVGASDAGVCLAVCTENGQCEFGQACRSGCCKPGCDTSDDCGNGQTCQSGRCAEPVSGTDGGGPPPSDGGGAGQGAVGDACTSEADCAGGSCLGLPGGYCSMRGCEATTNPCPSGSECFGIGNNDSACFKTCAAESECRVAEGYTCDGDMTCYTPPAAVDGGTTTGPCSATVPNGTCPNAQVCQNGTCQTFACDSRFEPNNTQSAATALPAGDGGVTPDLTICAADKDWYSVSVPPGKITMVGVKFAQSTGDLDMQAYSQGGQCLGNRYTHAYCGLSYPRSYEVDEEYLSFLNGGTSGERSYAVQVQGRTTAVTNVYSLNTQTVAWQDGRDCTEVDASTPCNGGGSLATAKLIQFPFADPSDPYLGDSYRFDSMSNYRWLRRETIALVRYAIKETQAKFASTKPIGLIDMCQHNAITPGYDVNDPRHPESTHDQGSNIDIAYYTTLASAGSLEYNEARIICGPVETGAGSNNDGSFCTAAAATQHVVDLPRQVYFMSKLFESARVRVIGADRVIAPLLQAEATRQKNAGDITATVAAKFTSKLAFGDGWPFHHHHIHLSLQWWGTAKPGERAPADGCGFDLKKQQRRAASMKGSVPASRP